MTGVTTDSNSAALELVSTLANALDADDFEHTLQLVISLGGDADTTGAIVGAISGATVGDSGIPAEWVAGVWEWATP